MIERLRKEVPLVPGGRLFLMADQDLQFGGSRDQTSAQYSYILQSGDLAALRLWYPKVVAALRGLPQLTAIDAREGRGAAQEVTPDCRPRPGQAPGHRHGHGHRGC